MAKVYERINWEDLPSKKTPINAENLNKMDKAIDKLDDKIVELEENGGSGGSSGDYLEKENPVGTGSFSMNRKANTTVGNCSHAEGYDTTASGLYSHAEGYNTTAKGNFSHAEGGHTTASGGYSHAEGDNTTANGNFSHAEGYDTTASGGYSHAEGYNTTASGYYSHAEGRSTIASGTHQHVQGKYNVEDTKNEFAHIVGGGTSDTDRKNIHTLDWNGNAVFSGDVTNGNGVSLNGLKTLIEEETNTNDMTLAYTEAEELTELTSGEKLTVAFGKLAKAVKDLISHLADKVVHITAEERASWKTKIEHLGLESQPIKTKERGWYRIAMIKLPSSYGNETTFQLGRAWSPLPEMIDFTLIKSYHPTSYQLIVNRRSGNVYTTKVRILYKDTNPQDNVAYLDVYSNTTHETLANRLDVRILHDFCTLTNSDERYRWKYLDEYTGELAEIPEGYSAIEFDLTKHQIQADTARIKSIESLDANGNTITMQGLFTKIQEKIDKRAISNNFTTTDETMIAAAPLVKQLYEENQSLKDQISTLNSNKVSVNVASGATVSTGINVNAGSRGKTYLVMASGNSNTGNASVSEIGMIRCGYDGNNYSYTNIAFSGGTSTANAFLQFSVKDGILYVGANFAVTMRVTFIVN